MTYTQIINDLRAIIGPGNPLGNDALGVWVNGAYMYMCDQIAQQNPDYFTTTDTASTVAGWQEYDLPADLERVIYVNLKVAGTWYRCTEIQSINDIPQLADQASYQGYVSENPRYYILGQSIGFEPVPQENGQDNIFLSYVYTPLEMQNPNDVPQLPAKFHNIIKYGAYADFLDQDDQHGPAQNMRALFQQRVEEMVESLHRQSDDEPMSITIIEDANDLYRNSTDVY